MISSIEPIQNLNLNLYREIPRNLSFSCLASEQPILVFFITKDYQFWHRVAKTHRMPYLYRSFSYKSLEICGSFAKSGCLTL